MKVKLKFDLNSMQKFFIRHVEKFVFGGAIIALVCFAWSSMGRDQIDLTPEQLIKIAGDTQDMVDRTLPKPTRQATLYSEVAKKIRQDIPERGYLPKIDWNPPVIAEPHPRPPLPALTVEALRASAGHGAVMSVAAGGGVLAQNRGTAGIRWAMITGLIPLQKQVNEALDAYRETLPAFDPARDIPQIAWFQVQRAEVGAKADLDHLEWSAVSVTKNWDKYGDFRGLSREVVSENYLYNVALGVKGIPIVFPPPPMGEDHIWGDELAHLPEIQRMANRDEDQRVRPKFPIRPSDRLKPKPPRPAPEAPKPEGNEPDVPGVQPENNGDGPSPPVTDGPVAPANAGSPAGPIPGGPIPGTPMPRGSIAGGGPRKFVAPGGFKMPGGIAGDNWDRDQPAPVRLFRFFDFTVQPGKRYRYRVQLWWTNPNYGIPRQYLVNADDSKEAYVKTEWSAPSEPAGVPRCPHPGRRGG